MSANKLKFRVRELDFINCELVSDYVYGRVFDTIEEAKVFIDLSKELDIIVFELEPSLTRIYTIETL